MRHLMRDSCLTRGRSTGATGAKILSSRLSATFEAITRADSAAFESAGQHTMRLLTSCSTGRHPRTPARATLLRALSICGLTSSLPRGRPGPLATIHRKVRILQFSCPPGSQVIEEDTPHRPSVFGANRNHSGGSTSVCADRVLTSLSKFRENHLDFTGEPSAECALTASQPHVDLGLAQPMAERSPPYTRIYLCDFALMTNLSYRVIKEESQQHHPTVLGAIHH